MRLRNNPRLSFLICALVVFVFGTAFSAEISFSRIDNAIGAQYKTLSVSVDSIVSDISSFNITISYDQSSSLLIDIIPGNIFSDCGWEYFNYRIITKDTVVTTLPDYPVNLINVTGIASLSQNPPPNCDAPGKSLFDIKVLLERDFFFDHRFRPFRFFWRDCRDNQLISSSGDTVFAANQLFENRSPSQTRIPFVSGFPGYGHPSTACPSDENASIIYNLDFVNSGISPMSVDSGWCYSGDLNLNGVRFEIADIVIFISYFTIGVSVFMINPPGQIAATDCNCDGVVLTVADLVCFVRVAAKEEGINPKIPVNLQTNVELIYDTFGNTEILELLTDNDIALVYTRVSTTNNSALSINEFEFNDSFRIGQIGDTITILQLNLNGNPILSAGTHSIFEYTGASELAIEAWTVDMNGVEKFYKLESAALPDSPELLQNYPNPFNPSTTIEFSLPTYSDWNIEIYNITGQLINNFSGSSVGQVEIEWDGRNLDGTSVSSGVYFYKLVTLKQITSRKMLLLK